MPSLPEQMPASAAGTDRPAAPCLRLLADDLTGALDTSAELVPLAGPITVRWDRANPSRGSVAFDLGTREGSRAAAVTAAQSAAQLLREGNLAYFKVDSLLRGHGMAELGAVLSQACFEHCIVAPAFPHQGRFTRASKQFRLNADGTLDEVGDIIGQLAAAHVEARPGSVHAEKGVLVFDADTDSDLDEAVSFGRTLPGRVLWCGSAGLASALARHETPATLPSVHGPVLGLFGSDQSATAAQLAACGQQWVVLPDGSAASGALITGSLERDGVVLASFAIPDGASRREAAAHISMALGTLALRLPQPGTLLVAGGETLRALCAGLGTRGLAVIGHLEPGLPVSVMRGGRWDGLRVVSKSGAFGGPTLWRDLVAPLLSSKDAPA